MNDECLFCRLAREGDHVARGEGVVAIRDINPQADTHLLVIPKRHVASFEQVGELEPELAKRLLEFTAETARGAGLSDYRIAVNVGRYQTVPHLHLHILGGRLRRLPE